MARRSREVISSYLCWWVIPLSHADSPLASVAMFCVLGKWVKKNWTVRYDDGPCLFPETAPLQVRLAIRSAQSHVHQYYSYSFTAYLAHYSIKNRQCWSNSELCILYLHICLLHLTQPGRRCADYRVQIITPQTVSIVFSLSSLIVLELVSSKNMILFPI